jgi:hypothetical protein
MDHSERRALYGQDGNVSVKGGKGKEREKKLDDRKADVHLQTLKRMEAVDVSISTCMCILYNIGSPSDFLLYIVFSLVFHNSQGVSNCATG